MRNTSSTTPKGNCEQCSALVIEYLCHSNEFLLVKLSYNNKKCIPWASFNPLSTNLKKWSNTLKQFVGNLPTSYLSVFDHFVVLAHKGLMWLLGLISVDFKVTAINLPTQSIFTCSKSTIEILEQSLKSVQW